MYLFNLWNFDKLEWVIQKMNEENNMVDPVPYVGLPLQQYFIHLNDKLWKIFSAVTKI